MHIYNSIGADAYIYIYIYIIPIQLGPMHIYIYILGPMRIGIIYMHWPQLNYIYALAPIYLYICIDPT